MITLLLRSIDPNNVRGADPHAVQGLLGHRHESRLLQRRSVFEKSSACSTCHKTELSNDPAAFKRFVMLGLVGRAPDGFSITELGRKRLAAEHS